MHPVITKVLRFDAGHRVLGHGGRCRCLHGHGYLVEVSVRAKQLDELGMVIDFGCVKEQVGGWIDRHLDHNMILHPDDPLLELPVDGDPAREEDGDLGADMGDEDTDAVVNQLGREIWAGKKPYVIPLQEGMPAKFANPTAENLARHLFQVSEALLTIHDVQVVKVKLHETPTCFAEYPCSR